MREMQRDDRTVMVETPVGHMLIKSAPGRVVQNGDRYQIDGMAWGPNPISTVEVKVDNGAWQKAKLDGSKAPFTWQAWTLDWKPVSGEHTITRGRSMHRVPCSQRRMIRSLPTRRPTGRATGRSRATCRSPKPTAEALKQNE